MHEAAFKAVGLKAYYVVLEFAPKDFRKAAKQLSRWMVDGFNVTVPYKEAIISYLDGLTPEAKAIGAANTIFRKGKKWIGANTDVDGFLLALKQDAKFKIRGKKILVVGAGGSARAVIYGLAKAGAQSVLIVNRHESKAKKLARDFKNIRSKTELRILPLQKKSLKENLASVDLVVNATSVGLKKSDRSVIEPSLIPKATGKKRLLFFDLIYHVPKTSFLSAAHQKGHRVMNGLGMLAFQGAKAFECWTNQKAPVSVMKKTLFESLKARQSR